MKKLSFRRVAAVGSGLGIELAGNESSKTMAVVYDVPRRPGLFAHDTSLSFERKKIRTKMSQYLIGVRSRKPFDDRHQRGALLQN